MVNGRAFAPCCRTRYGSARCAQSLVNTTTGNAQNLTYSKCQTSGDQHSAIWGPQPSRTDGLVMAYLRFIVQTLRTSQPFVPFVTIFSGSTWLDITGEDSIVDVSHLERCTRMLRIRPMSPEIRAGDSLEQRRRTEPLRGVDAQICLDSDVVAAWFCTDSSFLRTSMPFLTTGTRRNVGSRVSAALQTGRGAKMSSTMQHAHWRIFNVVLKPLHHIIPRHIQGRQHKPAWMPHVRGGQYPPTSASIIVNTLQLLHLTQTEHECIH